MFMIDLGAPSYYSALGVSPDADAKVVRASCTKLVGDLARKFTKERNPEEKRRIEEQMQNLNAILKLLGSPVKRAEYDSKNVHLTFFHIRKAAVPLLAERGLLLRWMHRAVRSFLMEKGEALEPVSDLERSDFSQDFSPNELLDSLLNQG